MEIRSIEIRQLYASGLKGDYNGVCHIKSLPCLSIVQAVHGRYEVTLGDQHPVITEEGGAFVAPSGMRQEIVHRNGTVGYMEAQWVFMTVTVNELFAFEDVFTPPALIPAQYSQELSGWIGEVRGAPTLCARYAAAYRLADLLIGLSTPKEAPSDPAVSLLKRYIEDHYKEPVTQEKLAKVASCSVANLYRIFSKSFGLSPRNYINKLRLEKAAVLLETGTLPINEVAEAVGFEDPVYFSRLFKESYHLSPKNYRHSSVTK